MGFFKSFLRTSSARQYAPLYSYEEDRGAWKPSLTWPWERQWSTTLVLILIVTSSITSAWMGYFVASKTFHQPEAKNEGMLILYVLKIFAVLT